MKQPTQPTPEGVDPPQPRLAVSELPAWVLPAFGVGLLLRLLEGTAAGFTLPELRLLGGEWQSPAPAFFRLVEFFSKAGEPEPTLRILSLVAGCLALVPIIALGRRLVASPLSLGLGVVLLAWIPFQVHLSSTLAPSAWSAPFVALALWACFSPSPRRGLRLMAFCLAAVVAVQLDVASILALLAILGARFRAATRNPLSWIDIGIAILLAGALVARDLRAWVAGLGASEGSDALRSIAPWLGWFAPTSPFQSPIGSLLLLGIPILGAVLIFSGSSSKASPDDGTPESAVHRATRDHAETLFGGLLAFAAIALLLQFVVHLGTPPQEAAAPWAFVLPLLLAYGFDRRERARTAQTGAAVLALGLLTLSVSMISNSSTPDLRPAVRSGLDLGRNARTRYQGQDPRFAFIDTGLESEEQALLRKTFELLDPHGRILESSKEIPVRGDRDFSRPLVLFEQVGVHVHRNPESIRVLDGRESLLDPPELGFTDRTHWSANLYVSKTGQDIPREARLGVWERLQNELFTEFDVSDGRGYSWLKLEGEDEGDVVAAGQRSWSMWYEAGRYGIVEGGAIFLHVPRYWHWTPPQASDPKKPGYVFATTEVEGLSFKYETLVENQVRIELVGRGLEEGEKIVIHYGAGEALARADVYAERSSQFWILVDGNGDNVRRPVKDSPVIDVLAGDPARLIVTNPSIVRPGEEFLLRLAVLDRSLNFGCEAEGEVRFPNWPEGWGEAPESVLEIGDQGLLELYIETPSDLEPTAEAVQIEVELETPSGVLEAVGNPMLVDSAGPKIYWGDLHGHSNLSDGTGVPEDYFAYARDVAGLEVAALTDHDHYSVLPLSQNAELFHEIRYMANQMNEDGFFVAIPGFEWTNWIHGHRHVLYFDDEGTIRSALDGPYSTAPGLWAALQGEKALTIPHHPGGNATKSMDWSTPPHPEFETVVEISSVHGSSEAMDSPNLIGSPVPDAMVRSVLDRGYRLGFLGSGDSHDGHPGLSWEAPHHANGGLAGILADDLSRDGVYRALMERRVYATNGPRIVLRVALDGHPMGSIVPVSELQEDSNLYIRVEGTAPIESVEVIHNGRIQRREITGTRLEVLAELEPLAAGDYLYVRVIQSDRGTAWSSPIFID